MVTPFRRSIPTTEGGWVIVSSDPEGIRIEPNASGPIPHLLTAAQALSLADALRTAASHQTLVIPQGAPQ